MDLNAAVSDPEANSYLELAEADEMMSAFLHADEWDALEEERQQRLLMRGTTLIDSYTNWGLRQVEDQALAFPREDDAEGVLPREVKLALCEYLDYMADGSMEPLKKLQAEGVTSTSMLGMSSSFEKDASQLPAGARAQLDRLKERGAAPQVENLKYCDDDPETLFQ